jgi:hypothetical protein
MLPPVQKQSFATSFAGWVPTKRYVHPSASDHSGQSPYLLKLPDDERSELASHEFNYAIRFYKQEPKLDQVRTVNQLGGRLISMSRVAPGEQAHYSATAAALRRMFPSRRVTLPQFAL